MSALEQGIVVMVLGMGIVFLLLLLLVLAVTLQTKFVAFTHKFWPEAAMLGAQKSPVCKKECTANDTEGLDEDEKIAIVIALAMHAKRQNALNA